MVVYSSAPFSSSDWRTEAMVEPFWPTATYTQRTCLTGSPDSQLARWLMIASMAIAVLPVCRSPMISCRWPRPIAVIASMALMPVCSGSFTGWRSTTEGAWVSSGRSSVSSIGPLPSSGSPPRPAPPPREPSPDRHREDLAGPADLLALLDLVELAQDHDADLAHVQVQRQTADAVLEHEQLVGHGRRQALDAR